MGSTQPPRLIGIHGFKQSGKDTLADLLVREYGFKRVAFADKLKESLNIIFGVPKDKLWGSEEDKQSLSPVRWNDLHSITREAKDHPEFLTIRELMQIFATEICRDKMPEIWVKFLEINSEDKIAVSDLRFENEAQFLRSKGAYLIRVTRPQHHASSHSSEHALPESLMDDQLDNDSDLESFLEKARKHFEQLGLLREAP